MKQGKLIALSAPSGTGKTTICKELLRKNKDWLFSVSVTTREQRDGEIHRLQQGRAQEALRRGEELRPGNQPEIHLDAALQVFEGRVHEGRQPHLQFLSRRSERDGERSLIHAEPRRCKIYRKHAQTYNK